jgi:GT2 family glycosyltransferase
VTQQPCAPQVQLAATAEQPVAVVIVTWNSREDIARCLDAVIAERPAEIVVIDNGSSDGTAALVRERYSPCRLITLESNVGFAAGCNRGVAASRAPFVLFLNADAQVECGYLQKLVAALEGDPGAASATGKLYCERDGRRFIDSAGIILCAYALRPLDRGYGEPDLGQFDLAEEIFGPSGAAALFRRSALAAAGAGPFDEELFAYYEDVDLAWRLRRLGFRHLYIPAATCRHDRRGPQSKPKTISARAFANRYVVWAKNESLGRFLLYAPLAIPWELVRLVRRARRGVPLELGAALSRVLRHLRRRLWRRA